MKKILIVLLFVLSFNSAIFCQTPIRKTLVKTNLEFLASDELEGRQATTRGEKIASLYIAKELEKYGIKPFGDNNTFYQNFELWASKPDKKSTVNFGDLQLSFKKDFLLFNKRQENYSRKTRCVFAGYGISAKEFEYDDYSNVDVKGKAVIIVNGEPFSENSNFFNGSEETKYSRYRYKIENAVKHGASEIIFLPASKEEQKSYWYYLLNNSDKESLELKSDGNREQLLVLGYKALEKILKEEKISYKKFTELQLENELPASFEFEKEISFDLRFNNNTKISRNVIGYIEGTDDKLKNEFVTITAHYDHVGFQTLERVYNGADDNGSGTVAVMETARLISANPFKRSVIVCLFAAEEKGLLGSTYFVKNHPSLKNTMVNINLDMVARGNSDTLFSLGEGRLSSELKKIVVETDENMVDYTIDLSKTNSRWFYQSDHLSFHNAGIPCLLLNDMDFTDLHRITDETKKINWIKLYKSIDFTYRLVKRLANLEHNLVIDKNLE